MIGKVFSFAIIISVGSAGLKVFAQESEVPIVFQEPREIGELSEEKFNIPSPTVEIREVDDIREEGVTVLPIVNWRRFGFESYQEMENVMRETLGIPQQYQIIIKNEMYNDKDGILIEGIGRADN